MSIWTAASDLDWLLEAGIIGPEDDRDDPWEDCDTGRCGLDCPYCDKQPIDIDDLPPPRTEASEP